jgi:hypothetical protein
MLILKDDAVFVKNFKQEIGRLGLTVPQPVGSSSFEASARNSSASASLTLSDSEKELRKNSMASMLSLRSSFNMSDEKTKRLSGNKSVAFDSVIHEDDPMSIEKDMENPLLNLSPVIEKPSQPINSNSGKGKRNIFKLFERRH